MKKKNKKIIIAAIITVIILGLGTSIAVGYYRDKQKFINVSDDINIIMNKLGFTNEIKRDRYCIYNNMKYSKGNLSCVVEASLIINAASINNSELSSTSSNLRWNKYGTNLESWKEEDGRYIFANLYQKGNLRCSIRDKGIDTKQSKLEIDCSGPAKAEWFPVREN